VGSCDRIEKEICTKKRENLFFVQRRKRRSGRVHLEADKEGIYLTIKITTDYISILCRKEGWEKENSIRLIS